MPITFSDTTGQSIYVRFDDASDTAVQLTEGVGLKAGRYSASDDVIDAAGLAAGTYTARIFVGTAAAQAASDLLLAVGDRFVWNGASEVDQLNAIHSVLPFGGDTIAGADDVGGPGGFTQPRVNKPPGPGFTFQVSRRADGTHKCTRDCRLQPGALNNLVIGIDLTPLFGRDNFVNTVGIPTVSGGSITSTALGPRDTLAMVELDGIATANEARTLTVPVEMDTGEQLNVVLDVKVFAE